MNVLTESAESKVVLRGEFALALWRKGKDKWNKWVEQNHTADVDFSNVDFSNERIDQDLPVSFASYNFPKGRISFCNANFGDGDVSFSGTNFEGGDVSFQHATFGTGRVTFTLANFSGAGVSFIFTNFGDGEVCFASANFSEGATSFENAIFGCGTVLFLYANFSDAEVTFYYANFGNGDVIFDRAKFDNVSFECATLGDGCVGFNSCEFNGNLIFSNLIHSSKVESISFKHSTFKESFDLSQNNFNCVIDLTLTKKANQLSLEGLVCDPKFSKLNGKYSFSRADDKEDIPRLRRLKEIAEDNKDHERALDFHAWEMRAKRWHVNKEFWGLLLDFSYDFFSNYGRSEKRPLFWLFITWLLFCIPYFLLSPAKHFGFSGGKEKFGEALSFSAGQMIPFIPGSRIARAEGVNALFSGDLSFYVHLFTFGQSLISFGFLFLIGLALRNRFRI